MEIEVSNIIKMKKKHPCGCFEWEVLRTGTDIKIKCLGCGHIVMTSRDALMKNIKEIRKDV